MRYLGLFAYQPNNSTRQFEYPWAYSKIAEHCAAQGGRPLRVVDIGGSLGGLQWVLARDGHDVINIDPGGVEARELGWDVNSANHRDLCRAFGVPVLLIPKTLAQADLETASTDVLLSVSTLEHFTPSDLSEFSAHATRILRPGGVAVLTVDLFLDLKPFTAADHNMYGTNVDMRALLDRCGLTLREGNRTELFGFPEFSASRVLQNTTQYMVGKGYPALAQCLVAHCTAG